MTEIQLINTKMFNLINSRFTLPELMSQLQEIGNKAKCVYDWTEEGEQYNDYSINTNIGMIGEVYLDYEIFMLPTNKPEVYLITEIQPF